MSISITGMNMPKCCADCELLYDYMRCSVTGTRADFEKMDNERLPNCPLKEIINNYEVKPQGKWIPMNPDCRGYSDYFKCSICGAYIYPNNVEKELDYNGCPYCFADMRGDKND